MLEKEKFGKWARTYDDDVTKQATGYPFEGYFEVLAAVQEKVPLKSDTKVLDIGIGTGALSKPLYDAGVSIVGLDFSEAMLAEAKAKMPMANMYLYSLLDPLPEPVTQDRFDVIVSSFAFHHVDDNRKFELIDALRVSLKPRGKIIIADVGFENLNALDAMRGRDDWDEDEFYLVADDLLERLREKGFKCSYTQISCCAGVLEIVF